LRKCNRDTGGAYGLSYAAFVSQVAKAGGIEDRERRTLVGLRRIHPLRVMKQMMSMLLAAQPRATPPQFRGLREFVVRRDARLPADAPQVYLYKNVSALGRIVPICGISELLSHRKLLICSEISWPPLGIVFSLEPHERLAAMPNVTHWGQHRFKDTDDFLLRMPPLKVETDWPPGSARHTKSRSGRRGSERCGSARTPMIPPARRSAPPGLRRFDIARTAQALVARAARLVDGGL